MMKAEILVRIPKMWVTEIPKRHEVSIKIVNRRRSGKMGVRDLIEITGSQENLKAVLLEFKHEPWVKSYDLDFVESGKLIGEVLTYKCLACAMLADSKCHLISANGTSEGRVLWRIMTSDRDDVKKLVGRLNDAMFNAELLRLTPITEHEVLTRRQEELIMMAFEKGYFDTPRKVKLKNLAQTTGVSQATLSEILRKGQKRIVVDYLRDKRKFP
jgi:predicted DNA binding protein